jgi:CDP-2,3-bis-(O-geranylgeranyl)-sn-glycerol synthase
LDYHQWLLIGLLLGVGALVGDAVKSFIKRRIGIPPGNSLAIFDQIDFVIGAIIFISFIKKLNFNLIITIVIISYILNVLVNSISYYLKIRTDRW